MVDFTDTYARDCFFSYRDAQKCLICRWTVHIDMVEDWLKQAKMADDGSEMFQKGISVLERLLNQIVPQKTALMQNYPNPFNPDTWIPYQLKEGTDVSIVIYDATGRIVRRLDIGHKYAGVYRTQDRAAHWDGRNEAGEPVASGAYFVVLKQASISRCDVLC